MLSFPTDLVTDLDQVRWPCFSFFSVSKMVMMLLPSFSIVPWYLLAEDMHYVKVKHFTSYEKQTVISCCIQSLLSLT